MSLVHTSVAYKKKKSTGLLPYVPAHFIKIIQLHVLGNQIYVFILFGKEVKCFI